MIIQIFKHSNFKNRFKSDFEMYNYLLEIR